MTVKRKILWAVGAGLVVACLIVELVLRVTATAVRVTSDAMEPTLHVGDRLLVDHGAYAHAAPQRGHVVAYRHQGQLQLGRVLGLPGERVAFLAGEACVDDEPLVEHYVRGKLNASVSDIAVPQGHVFVFRDNRDLPLQVPQEVYCLPLRQILGRATFRYWPPGGVGKVK